MYSKEGERGRNNPKGCLERNVGALMVLKRGAETLGLVQPPGIFVCKVPIMEEGS